MVEESRLLTTRFQIVACQSRRRVADKIRQRFARGFCSNRRRDRLDGVTGVASRTSLNRPKQFWLRPFSSFGSRNRLVRMVWCRLSDWTSRHTAWPIWDSIAPVFKFGIDRVVGFVDPQGVWIWLNSRINRHKFRSFEIVIICYRHYGGFAPVPIFESKFPRHPNSILRHCQLRYRKPILPALAVSEFVRLLLP